MYQDMHQGTKSAVVIGLKRIDGQVGGLLRIVEEDRHCLGVLTQIHHTIGRMTR
jgi:DNA-binding FrmR family transcriptional regulator